MAGLVGIFLTTPYPRADTTGSQTLIQVFGVRSQNPFQGDEHSKSAENTIQIFETFFPEPIMNDEQLTQEIRDANLTYLMLAQNVIRKDKAEALFRLGISEESADLIATLSPAQILKIASSPMLLCRFRVDDDMVWGLLTNHTVSKVNNDATTKLHASILMAGRFSEAI
jgi:flagellar transcriptional activator FlhD